METGEPHRASGPRAHEPGRRRGRTAAAIALALVLALLVAPLVWPVGPVPGAVEPSELAWDDSRFVDVDGVEFHYLQQGDGECVVILLHGFGASAFSWRETLDDLSARCTVIAFDRPAFGLTERPTRGEWRDENPYTLTAAADQTIALMDALEIERAILVGHSAGGTVATIAASRYPERVRGLVLEAPAIYTQGGVPQWIRPVLATPQARRIGPLLLRRQLAGDAGEEFIRAAWADPSAVTEETLEGYRRPLRVADWDRALWEFTIAPRTADPVAALGSLTMPTLVIAGEQDTYVPYEQSARLAEELRIRFVTFEDAGHIPHEEHPARFSNEIFRFLDDLVEAGGP